MIEDPYRWVEAINNRREYIEHQLSEGSPIVCLSCDDGVLLLTLSRERQKIFEIYDRIAVGAIGHPGDIERLRMAAIEATSSEGFTRSAQDVSLRRLVSYTLSPALKAGFEQIYEAPYLARMLFVEVGRNGGEQDLFIWLDYDGSFHTNGGTFQKKVEPYAAISGRQQATERMREFLSRHDIRQMSLEEAEAVALDAWTVGILASREELTALPSKAAIDAEREKQLASATVEAALLERHSPTAAAYKPLRVELVEKSAAPA